jgi:hypothetical protein
MTFIPVRVDRCPKVSIFNNGTFWGEVPVDKRWGLDGEVLSGGTAVNALANMHLLERFDEAWLFACQSTNFARLRGRRACCL